MAAPTHTIIRKCYLKLIFSISEAICDQIRIKILFIKATHSKLYDEFNGPFA